MDKDGPTIAATFYEELFFGGPDGRLALKPDMTKSDLALHLAVKKPCFQPGISFCHWRGVCKKKTWYTRSFYLDKVSQTLPLHLPKKEINHVPS